MNTEQPTQTALASALGLARSRITALKKDGMPVDSIEAALAWRKARQNIARRNPVPVNPSGGNQPETLNLEMTHDEARTRREIAEASIAQMKEAEMRGKFLLKAEVDAAVFEIARSMRDGLTNCARRIAADVAGLSKADDCEAVIDREHRALLESMTSSLSHKLSTNAQGSA